MVLIAKKKRMGIEVRIGTAKTFLLKMLFIPRIRRR